jgi:cysteine sulfinate desulfinase/cysteine desulfurase-like protein
MMRKTPIYLDNNATTPLRAAAITAMQDAMGPPAIHHRFMALDAMPV